jgi:hypothetical protein
MRPFLVKKHNLFLALAAILIFSLIAPPFINACGCLCGSGELAGQLVAADEAQALPEPCCCAGACGPEPSVDEFFDVIGTVSSCDDHPVCCCDADPAKKLTVRAAVLADDPRPQFNELRYQEAGPSAFMPDLPFINGRSCFAFQKNITPTPPHIASTILLI